MKAKPIPTSPKNRPAEEQDQNVEAFMRDADGITKPTVVRFSFSVFFIAILASVVVATGVSVSVLYGRDHWGWLSRWLGTTTPTQTIVRTVTRTSDAATFSSDTVKTVAQNVVSIYVRRVSVGANASLLDQLYMPTDRRGTGVLLTEDGVGVTTRRAIPDLTKEIAVVTHDQTVYLTKDFHTDPASDLVFFQLSARGLPVVDYADVAGLTLGETVLSVARQPSSLAPDVSVTSMATLEHYRINDRFDLLRSSERLSHLLQVRASIDVPGVPVFSTDGKLVGLHTGTDGDVIPVTTIQSGAQRMQKTGSVSRNFFGVRYVDLAVAKGLLLKPTTEGTAGALLTSAEAVPAVQPKSPADRAGLQAGDVITKVNEIVLTATTSLSEAIQSIAALGVATVTFVRDGKEQSVPVTLEVTGS